MHVRSDHIPAKRSSFSLPLIRILEDTSSPVPMEPCLPLRNTKALTSLGLLPYSSRLVPAECLVDLITSLGPTGTTALDVDFDGGGFLLEEEEGAILA